ncbi:MAG: hypothetical protein U0325_18870 [Polyangiales bacterium]
MSDDDLPAQRPDPYEAQYMSADGGVLHERRRMPGWFFALMGVIAAAELGASIAAMSVFPALLALPVLAAMTLLLSHLRVVLTPEHLHIQYGLWGPKVALRDIVSMRVESYSMMRYGGFGIRRSLDGVWAYSTPGGNGQALVIEARDGKGGTRTLCVTLDRAQEFKRRIEEMQASTGVRVAVDRDAGAQGEGHEVSAADDAAAKRRA